MKELVSVIVPTYNQAGYLPTCLDALMFQEYPSLEIIVVNDGAQDDTAAVLEAYIAGLPVEQVSFASRYDEATDRIERTWHPRYPAVGRSLRVITHEHNRGLAPALNTGFRAATGAYCTYVPSDDVCYPAMLAEMAAVLDQGADFVYADMFIVDDAGRILRRFALPDYSIERCFADWYLCGVAKLYRRDLHERVGWYDEALLAHDHDLFQRFAMHGAVFSHLPKALMAVRDHDRSREVDIHSPENWKRLLEESKTLVRALRAWLAAGRPAGEDGK